MIEDDVDINSYEFRERLAILQENKPDMHPKHAFNKAKKEIAERMKNRGKGAEAQRHKGKIK